VGERVNVAIVAAPRVLRRCGPALPRLLELAEIVKKPAGSDRLQQRLGLQPVTASEANGQQSSSPLILLQSPLGMLCDSSRVIDPGFGAIPGITRARRLLTIRTLVHPRNAKPKSYLIIVGRH
jgi:hypothetical protein